MIVMEAMFRLKWRVFVQWLSQQGDRHADETLVIDQVIDCLQTLDERKYGPTAIHTMCNAIEFTVFKTEARRVFFFWNDNVCMVQLLLQFIKADRTGR